MKFIGRQSELRTLEQEYRRDGGFVVIYGRRRVGKTRLIKEFIKDKPAVYFLATEEVEAQSMKRMAGVIARATGNALLGNVTFSDWADLFRAVAAYQPDQKKVIVLDEFPYMVKTNPAFPSILQNIWDEFLQDSNIMLILSGSLIGMMKKHALSYDSPLYGRRTAQIRLMPLPFTAVYAAQSLPFDQAVQQYALTGGVPKYLEFFTEQEPLIDQIRSIVLSKNGFLYEEPNFLLRDEVQTPINYFSIIRVIADGNHKLSKICGVLEQESPSISPYLATLSELGFVVKDTPITEKNPEHSRKGLYFVSDNFTRFWFRYVYPYKGELELDNQQIVLDELDGCTALRLIEPQGAFYAFVDVRACGMDCDRFSRMLLDEEHVAVVPGTAFGSEGAGFVRLSYAGDGRELREGVRRMRVFAERHVNPALGRHTPGYHHLQIMA